MSVLHFFFGGGGGGAQEDGIAMKEGCTIKSQISGGGGEWGGHAPPIVTPPLGR